MGAQVSAGPSSRARAGSAAWIEESVHELVSMAAMVSRPNRLVESGAIQRSFFRRPLACESRD